MMNPLLDKDFLAKLDSHNEREVFARITALTFQESPTQEIQGKVTQGSVNIDGASAVRRTCSLTLVAKDVNINDYYWSMNTKFKLEIGLTNMIDDRYPEIIWFKMGTYLITSFNTSQSVNSYTISLQGKDKMSLLNGDISGHINASTDFGVKEKIDEAGTHHFEKIPIREIIKEAVHFHGGEPWQNIVINDLDEMGVELMESRTDNVDFYYTYDTGIQEYTQMYIGAGTKVYLKSNGQQVDISGPGITYMPRIDDIDSDFTVEPTEVYFAENPKQIFTIAKISYGDTAGYRLTDITYPGDLIAGIGETITSVLDKIKNMLGEFEYFYDVDGRFIFQKKRVFTDQTWTSIMEDKDQLYVENDAYVSACSYHFEGSNLVTAFRNTPNLSNLKNDFTIWGMRRSVTGSEIPVHLRYAIDKKPTYYKNLLGREFINETITKEEYREQIKQEIEGSMQTYVKKPNPNGLPEEWWDIMDWAEYYKQLTGDIPPGRIGQYCKYSADKSIRLNDYFPPGTRWTNYRNIYIFDVEADGTLGYFGHYDGCSHSYSYFLDRAVNGEGTSYIYRPEIPKIEYDEGLDEKVDEIVNTTFERYNQEWREIIYQMAADYFKHYHDEDFLIKVGQNNPNHYPTGHTGYEQYYTDIQGFWRQLFDPSIGKEGFDPETHWNLSIKEQPEMLNFWFDFLDTEGELAQFSCKAVGNRTKAINDNAIKAIYFRETPTVIIADEESFQTVERKPGYSYLQYQTKYDPLFSISAQGKSAKDVLDANMYQHAYCAESISMTTVPVYYLEPNTRIYVRDDNSKINGEYIVSKLTVPLTHNGTMSITATKAAERIY